MTSDKDKEICENCGLERKYCECDVFEEKFVPKKQENHSQQKSIRTANGARYEKSGVEGSNPSSADTPSGDDKEITEKILKEVIEKVMKNKETLSNIGSVIFLIGIISFISSIIYLFIVGFEYKNSLPFYISYGVLAVGYLLIKIERKMGG